MNSIQVGNGPLGDLCREVILPGFGYGEGDLINCRTEVDAGCFRHPGGSLVSRNRTTLPSLLSSSIMPRQICSNSGQLSVRPRKPLMISFRRRMRRARAAFISDASI